MAQRAGCGCGEGLATCGEVMECVGAHVGECSSLEYNPDTQDLSVKISDNANNALVRGPDCGLFVMAGSVPPDPDNCTKTVESIVASDFFYGGRGGGAANLLGWASPYAIDYAIGHNVDVIEAHSFALQDGVAAWSPVESTTAANEVTRNRSSSRIGSRNSPTWVGMTSDPGTFANPTGRSRKSPAAEREPDGGYFGYYQPQFSLMLAHEAMSRISGRAVVFLDTASAYDNTPPVPTTEEDVTACIEAVNRACYQSSAVIEVSPDQLGLVATIRSANIAACVAINAVTGIDPADIAATGAEFVKIEGFMTDEYIQSMVDSSGATVIMKSNSRHVETERAKTLGCGGVICNDPVYARNEFVPEPFLSYAGWGTQMGTLDFWSDQGQVSSAMGYAHNDNQGLFVYNAPWIASQTSGTSQLQHLLWGAMRRDVASVPAFTLHFEMKWIYDTLPGSSLCRSGVIFSQLSDVNMSGNDQDLLYKYGGQRTGYIAFFHVNSGVSNASRLVIGRFDGGQYTELASGPGGSVPSNTWTEFTLTVTATTIRFVRDGVAGGVTVTDSNFRGPYLGGATWNSTSAPGTWQTGFVNMDLSGVAGLVEGAGVLDISPNVEGGTNHGVLEPLGHKTDRT